MQVWLAIAGIVGVALAAGCFGVRGWLIGRRPADVERFAEKRGWRYQSSPSEGFFARLGPFRLFTAGAQQTRALDNLVEWEFSGAILRLFDFSYLVKAGERPSRQTVLHLEDARLALPAFTLEPEGPLERYLQVFGGPDINFEGHPGFSRKYVLRGDEPAAIYRLFRPELLDFFSRHPGLSVEGNGSRLLIYRKAKTVWPWRFDELWGLVGLGLLGLLLAPGESDGPDRLGNPQPAA
jgi:hypothetical protein